MMAFSVKWDEGNQTFSFCVSFAGQSWSNWLNMSIFGDCCSLGCQKISSDGLIRNWKDQILYILLVLCESLCHHLVSVYFEPFNLFQHFIKGLYPIGSGVSTGYYCVPHHVSWGAFYRVILLILGLCNGEPFVVNIQQCLEECRI